LSILQAWISDIRPNFQSNFIFPNKSTLLYRMLIIVIVLQIIMATAKRRNASSCSDIRKMHIKSIYEVFQKEVNVNIHCTYFYFFFIFFYLFIYFFFFFLKQVQIPLYRLRLSDTVTSFWRPWSNVLNLFIVTIKMD
jgi:hypothetical protein